MAPRRSRATGDAHGAPASPSAGQPTPTPPAGGTARRAADAVRRRRLELGWTQDQLAERARVSAATVRKVEAGAQTHYRDLTCTRLCAALGWPPEALDDVRARPPGPPGADAPAAADPVAPEPTATPTPTEVASDPSTPVPPPAGTQRRAELAALNGRLSQLDDRQWERLMAFVDGLTAVDD